MTELIEAMIRKAEADAADYLSRMSGEVIPQGEDLSLHDRVMFHRGQASGLRHALFALRTIDKERTNA